MGASFFTQSCAVNTVSYNIHEGQARIPQEKLPISVSRCLPVLEISDLPSYLQGRESESSECSSLLTLSAISFWNFRGADWIFLNTFNTLEEEVVNWLASQRSIETIGPMIPSFYLDKQLEEDKEFGLSLFKSNLDGCMEWLDSKETGPVVYVQFRSLAALGAEQMAGVDWGLKRSDCYFLWVAALAPNIPAMYELHFGVPMAGAVLCTLNVRHDSSMVSVLLKHSEAKLVFVDYQFLPIARGALEILSERKTKLPLLVLIPECGQPAAISPPGILEYESLLEKGKLDFEVRRPKDEWDPISLNYTSGTTSSPKGVIYSHRGAYLNSFAAALLNDMSSMPVYLWCVPMFHCNGWCLTWAVAAQGGTNVCQRNVTTKDIFENIARHKVTHMSGAPTVLNMIINASASEKRPLPGKVAVMTGGAPPASHVLFKMEELGFHVTHSYGLTETYGPGTVCSWNPEWAFLTPEGQAKIKARQGVQHLGLEELDIKDPATMKSVPADAKTMGEVMFRGNTVMNGYLKNLEATKDAFNGGWFRSGDLGVKHPDGYIELKDRSKDIIISGGENISSIEVESVLFSHPAVLEAAIVGRPDDFWGETPCAFVKLKDGCNANAEELIKFCRDHLPHYMTPRTVVFQELPKTSTGKVQKYVLKEKAKDMGSISKGNATSKL